MNDLTLPPTGVTMTSSEIAELTGKHHKNVIRDIREMISALENDGSDLSHQEDKDSRGYTTNFHLNRELTETLITGYSIPLRHKVIQRLHELERQVAAPRELTRIELLQIALEAEEEKQRLEHDKRELEHRIEADAPRVAFAKQVEIAPDAISVAQAAKILGTGRQRLFAFLRKIGWVTRYNEPYQIKIEAGYLDVKLGSWDHPDHGLQKSVTALVTGKGLVKLKEIWQQRESDLLTETTGANS